MWVRWERVEYVGEGGVCGESGVCGRGWVMWVRVGYVGEGGVCGRGWNTCSPVSMFLYLKGEELRASLQARGGPERGTWSSLWPAPPP